MKDGFFFSSETKTADDLDSGHPTFAPKLAATVRSWGALADLKTLVGESPKKALEQWLKENAAQSGCMSEENGIAK